MNNVSKCLLLKILVFLINHSGINHRMAVVFSSCPFSSTECHLQRERNLCDAGVDASSGLRGP